MPTVEGRGKRIELGRKEGWGGGDGGDNATSDHIIHS